MLCVIADSHFYEQKCKHFIQIFILVFLKKVENNSGTLQTKVCFPNECRNQDPSIYSTVVFPVTPTLKKNAFKHGHDSSPMVIFFAMSSPGSLFSHVASF